MHAPRSRSQASHRTRVHYVIPTRNRHGALARTLDRLAALGPHEGRVVVLDNASVEPVRAPEVLASGLPVTLLRLESNRAASARNVASEQSDVEDQDWLVMLDDDSHPLDLGLLDALREAPAEVGAVGAEVFLAPTGDPLAPAMHEAGGLPEVFIGCGAAIRAGAFRRVGGYDASFDYYVEEYDLCARLILAGLRVAFDRRFRVLHEKLADGRDFSRIVRNLVRNNCWVEQRYAPDHLREREVSRHLSRYAAIARKEHAQRAYDEGVAELDATLARQPRTPMTPDQYDRFTGIAACRHAIELALDRQPFASAAMVAPGKNEWCVRQVLDERGVRIEEAPTDASRPDAAPEALVIASLSPGPMLDASRRFATSGQRVVMPWRFGGAA